MTAQQLRDIAHIREPREDDADDWEMMDGILAGEELAELSHEGGELAALLKLRAEIEGQSTRYVPCVIVDPSVILIKAPRGRTRHDWRTCQDRDENHQLLFEAQLQPATDAFMQWSHDSSQRQAHNAEIPDGQGNYPVHIIDVFSKDLVAVGGGVILTQRS